MNYYSRALLSFSQTAFSVPPRLPLRWIAGGLVFLLTFTFFLGGGVYLHHFLSTESRPGEGGFLTPAVVLNIRTDGNYISVANGAGINAQDGRDLLVTGWFKLKKLPDAGGKMVLWSKKDGAVERSPSGFALAISGDEYGHSLSVFIGDGSDIGRRYSFPDVQIVPGVWFFVAMAVRENRYLGLYTGSLLPGRKPRVTLAGGYDLGKKIVAISPSDLAIGAVERGALRGQVGPFALYIPQKFGKDLDSILNSYLEELDSPSSEIEDNDIGIWIAGPEDIQGAAKERVSIESKPR